VEVPAARVDEDADVLADAAVRSSEKLLHPVSETSIVTAIVRPAPVDSMIRRTRAG
jgi:hypothetical protein